MKKKNVVTEKRSAGSLHSVVRRSFETFHDIKSWQECLLTTKEPWCFNGEVGIWKYRVTVEEVEEPKEVLEARLRKLWRECDNHKHWQPLKAMAEQLGIELTQEERRTPSPARNGYFGDLCNKHAKEAQQHERKTRRLQRRRDSNATNVK